MSCPDELTLAIHADGELSKAEAEHIGLHLERCADCKALLSRLESENAALMQVLAEAEALEPARSPAATWVWGVILAALSAPAMLYAVWQSTPALPQGLRWLSELGGPIELLSLSRSLLSWVFAGQNPFVSTAGFVGTLLVAAAFLGMPAIRRQPLARVGAGIALGLFFCLGRPSIAQAAEVRTEDGGTVKIAASESIADTVFMSGNTVIVAGVVEGDVFAVADRVQITGTVRGNLYCAGETITIDGEVTRNVHTVGKDVEFNSKIGGSAFAAGQNVSFNETSRLLYDAYLAGESVRVKGQLDRGLYFAADRIQVSGSVQRAVRGYTGHFALGSGSSVGGDVDVTVPAKDAAEIDDGAAVKGATRIDVKVDEDRDFLHAGFYLSALARTLALLLIGFVLVTLFPSLLPRPPRTGLEVLRQMGIGFVVLIATPVAAVLVALTVIGIPVAVLVAMAYVVVVYLSTLTVAYFAGQRLPMPKKGGVALGTGLSLLVILLAVDLPLVGMGLNFLVRIFGTGCLALHLKGRYSESRS